MTLTDFHRPPSDLPHSPIGAGTMVTPGAWLAPFVRTGVRCRIDSGVRIGVPGFGYTMAPDGRWSEKIEVFGVEIGDMVNIGANTVIARGSWRDTKVGSGTKIDAQVFIAHNVHLGAHCLVVACAEISGSCNIGDAAIIGPNVTIKERLTIGDGALIGAGAVVIRDVPAWQVWAGNPARYLRDRRPGEAI